MNPFIIRAFPIDKTGRSIETQGIFFNSVLLHANVGDILVDPCIEDEDRLFKKLTGTWKVTSRIFKDLPTNIEVVVRHELVIYIERQ